MLHCFGYLSSANYQTDDEALAEIINSSVRNNSENNITGLLCHFDGNFLQFLEGERTSINSTFARIFKDSRHSGIIEIYNKSVSERAFSDWSMALLTDKNMPPHLRSHCRDLKSTCIDPHKDSGRGLAFDGFLNAFKLWLR